MEFKDKVFVVTGGGNGIGREVVLQLLTKGAHVAALDLSEKGLAETFELAQKNSNLTLHTINVTDLAAVEAVAKEVVKKHKHIDGLLNVAGIVQPFIKVENLTLEQIERIMNVNFYGPLYTIRTFLPYLKKQPSTTCICNVSSMGGFLPVPGQSIYGASKAALKLLTEGLYAELLNTNVRVSVVFPGGVGTNILANSNVEAPKAPEGAKAYKVTSAPDAAKIILNGIKREKFRILVGSDAKAMDTIYRLAPKSAVNLITKQMTDLLK